MKQQKQRLLVSRMRSINFKEEIVQAAKEKNDLMSKQTQTLVLNEQKYKEEIAKYTKPLSNLKVDTRKTHC